MRSLVLAGFLTLAAAVTGAETRITVDFLSDGTCSIAVHAPASRSEISYRAQTPGRCAIPATRREGPVALEVLLPPGAVRPASSIPRLEWSEGGGRLRGGARLPAAPAFVDVMPAGYASLSRIYDLLLVTAAIAGAFWAVTVGTERP